MTFTTPVHIPASPRPITYDDRFLFLGSCFSAEISSRLEQHYFRLTANPFGVLYNPLSIAQALTLTEVPPLVEWGGLYHSMAHHGDFSSPDRDTCRRLCADSIATMQQALRDATVVVATFGTAWVYLQDGHVVANCHKMPASHFTRRRLSVEEIVSVWQPIVEQYPDKHFIFTVSPIRHLKDGLHDNALSKSTLLLAIDQLVNSKFKIQNSKLDISYFPSYEILLDELRDYRFYASDMLHPSSVAVDYIFERFAETCMSDATRSDMRTLHRLWLDRHHTLLHPDTDEARHFLQQTEKRATSLRTRFPWLSF